MSLTLLRILSLRHFRLKPLRACLTALSVATGVALLAAVHLVNEATLRSFDESVNAVAGKAKLSVTAGEAGFPTEVVHSILAVKSVWYAVPRIEAPSFLAGNRDAAESLMIFGLDLFLEGRGQFQAATDGVSTGGLSELLKQDTVILTHAFAARHGLTLRSTVKLATATGTETFTVRGLLSPVGPGKAYGGAMAMINFFAAQKYFGKAGKVDRFDLLTTDGADLDLTIRQLEAKLGTGYSVDRTEVRSRAFERTVRSYQMCLSLFGVTALLLAFFIVASTIEFSVSSRKRDIGIVRSLGGTRRFVMAVFASEGLVIGVAGSVLGVLAGVKLAESMVGVVEKSIQGQFHIPIPLSVIALEPSKQWLFALSGITVAVIASLPPAYRACSVAAPPRRGTLSRATIAAGVLGLLYVAVSSRFFEHPLLKLVEPGAAILPSVCFAPALFQWIMGTMRKVSRRGTTLLSLRYLSRLPARTANTVRNLTIGFSLVILIATVSASLKSASISFYRKTLHADLIVSSYGQLIDYSTRPLSEKLAEELKSVPGVLKDGVERVRMVRLSYGGKSIALKAFDRPAPALEYGIFETVDRPAREAGPALFAARDSVMVSESFSRRFHKAPGDDVELDTPSGRRPFEVVSIVKDYLVPDGVLYMSRERYKKYWADPLVTRFNVRVGAGADPVEVRREIDRRFGGSQNLMTTLAGEVRGQIVETVDRGFAFVRVLEALVLLIALLGLTNAMLLTVLERTRELGLLRAAGMTRKQLFRMNLREAFLVGAVSSLLAMLAGAGFSFLWISGTLTQVLGWRIDFHFPWLEASLTCLTGTAVATIAGLYPSFRVARLDVRDALASE